MLSFEKPSAEEGTRTPTRKSSLDPESSASAISPLRHICKMCVSNLIFLKEMVKMRIFQDSKAIKGILKRPALTLGNFDGIHLGHQKILQKVRERAREIGGEAVVYTFEPHPWKVLFPERNFLFITTFSEKVELFADYGIEVVICEKFHRAFSYQAPSKFVGDILVDRIGVREIFVGHDYAFGKDRRGGVSLLKRLGGEYHFKVEEVEAIKVNDLVVSSSKIRDLILNGRVREAARLLGRNYFIYGEVIPGKRRGETIGFPTANLKLKKDLLPQRGVYAVWVFLEARKYMGALNIGFNPTFGDEKLSVEVHILDFSGDLYQKEIKIAFVDRLREEKAFTSAQELNLQVKKDIQRVREILSSSP